jgi:hypothetical protein
LEEKYYVYEWYDVDTSQVFYVGKGSNNRYKYYFDRNDLFDEYYNSHNCEVRFVETGLNEDEAYGLEEKTIKSYRPSGQAFCNIMDGGKLPPVYFGEDNGMWGKTHTPETRQRISEINSDGRHKGENNTQFGVSPSERMSEEVYARWLKEQQENKVGERNPNFGKHTLHEYYESNPEICLENQSRPGKQNGRARKTYLYDKDYNFVAEFDYILECAQYLFDKGYGRSKSPKSMYPNIWKSMQTNVPYLSFRFSFEKI